MRLTERDEARFWSKVALPNGEGCMLWTGAVNGKSYGYMSVENRLIRVHRITYTLANGPIPEGLVIDHLCRVRHCVAPLHLEAVTQQENILRGDLRRGDHCPQGHAYEGDNLYVRPGTDRWECRTCHRESQRRRRLSPSNPS